MSNLSPYLGNRGCVAARETFLQVGEENLPWVRFRTPKERVKTLEVETALGVGEMIIRSALMRKESRGVHFRKDLPPSDEPKWKGNVLLLKSTSGVGWEFRSQHEIRS